MRFGLPVFLLALATTLTLVGCGQKKEETMKTFDLSAEANAEYLTDNKAKDDVKVTSDGLQYRVIKSGHGEAVTSGADQVTVSYKGWLIDGKVFDQTPPGETRAFSAGRLIPGWVEALRMMHEGDEWQLVIPASLGYGADGAGDAIPPNQTLVFDITLVSVAHETPPSP